MSRDKINRILTFIANIGVIGGIVFLAYEIRQNTSQMRAEAAYSINEGLEGINAWYQDPVMAEIIVRGDQDFGSMNPVEIAQYEAYQFSRLNLAIYIMNLEDEGLSDLHFPYVEVMITDFQSKPGLMEWLVSQQGIGSEVLWERLTATESTHCASY